MSAKNNTIQLKVSEIKELIKQRWRNRSIKTRPLCIVGHKGIGKTDAIRQAAEELAAEFKLPVKCITTNLQFCEPPDFLGLPYVKGIESDEAVTRHARPELLPHEGMGIWFLDEANRCSRDNRAGMLTLLQDRAVNAHKLGKDWIIVLAMNPTEADGVSYEVQEFDAALEDRISKIEFRGDVDEFIKYMVNRHTDQNPVVRWIMNQPEIVDFKGKLRTSPRGLDYLVAAIDASGGVNSPTFFNVVATEIGMEASHVFNKFLNSPENISAEEIVDSMNPVTVDKLARLEKEGRNDVLNTLVEAVATLVVGRGAGSLKENNLRNITKYLEVSGAETKQAFLLVFGTKTDNDTTKLFDKVVDFAIKNSKDMVDFLVKNDQRKEEKRKK